MGKLQLPVCNGRCLHNWRTSCLYFNAWKAVYVFEFISREVWDSLALINALQQSFRLWMTKLVMPFLFCISRSAHGYMCAFGSIGATQHLRSVS